MSPTKTATPSAVADGEPSAKKSRAGRSALTVMVLLECSAIIALSSIVSFWSISSLAAFFHWPPFLQILLMPMIELFVLAGMAEHVHQKIEGGRGIIPLALAWVAMLVSLACNVGQHTLMFIAAQPGTETWYVVVLGVFGALAPFGMIGGTHMLMTRIGRVVQAYRLVKPPQQGPGVGRQIVQAAGRRVVSAIDQPAPAPATAASPAPATTGPRAGARTPVKAGANQRKAGARAVDVMRAYWDEERTAGRLPTEAEMDRQAGTNRMAKKYRQRWLDEEQGVPHLEDRRAEAR